MVATPLWPRSIIFDLDETLLDRRKAWQYALEETLLTQTGRQVPTEGLVDEYRFRPWMHVLSVVVEDRTRLADCERQCTEIFRRSAMKRLTVHEGVGMALDSLRGELVEMGAISREPHPVAIKQIESTGLDRFLTVLAATPQDEPWDAGARVQQCLRFLGHSPDQAAFVSSDGDDLSLAEEIGLRAIHAAWAGGDHDGRPALGAPSELGRLVRR